MKRVGVVFHSGMGNTRRLADTLPDAGDLLTAERYGARIGAVTLAWSPTGRTEPATVGGGAG